MSLTISHLNRDDLLLACLRLIPGARSLDLPALEANINAAEAARATLASADATVHGAQADKDAAVQALATAEEAAANHASAHVLLLKSMVRVEVPGAAELLQRCQTACTATQLRRKGAGRLPGLIALREALDSAPTSPARRMVEESVAAFVTVTDEMQSALTARDKLAYALSTAIAAANEAESAAAAALSQLRRQVALETGGETSALYQRWKAPVNGLLPGRAARKTAA